MFDLSFSQPLAAACSGCALAGVAIVAAGLYLRRGGYDRHSVSRRGASSITTFAVGLMLAVAWWFGLREPEHELPDPALSQLYGSISLLPPSGALSIAVGDEFPEMAADGWVNGASPRLENLAGKVIVVDIWNEL